jgi:hypothetical protein
MKLTTVFASVNYTKNWKVLALIAGLILSTTLTSCSTTPTATPNAMKGDAMKDKDGAMKDKGGAMKGDAKLTPTTKP